VEKPAQECLLELILAASNEEDYDTELVEQVNSEAIKLITGLK
jgi:hypothetical protein